MRYITYCGALLFLALLSAQDIKEKQISVKKVIGFGALALICRIMPGNARIVLATDPDADRLAVAELQEK